MKPIELFKLPEWARWFALIEVNDSLVIQVASLNWPTWDCHFIPVFCKRDGNTLTPINQFPKDLMAASKDSHLWSYWPGEIKFDGMSGDLILHYFTSEDPPMRPASFQRIVYKSPMFEGEVVEHKSTREMGQPRPSQWPRPLQDCTIHYFGKRLESYIPPEPNWPVEKKHKSSGHNRVQIKLMTEVEEKDIEWLFSFKPVSTHFMDMTPKEFIKFVNKAHTIDPNRYFVIFEEKKAIGYMEYIEIDHLFSGVEVPSYIKKGDYSFNYFIADDHKMPWSVILAFLKSQGINRLIVEGDNPMLDFSSGLLQKAGFHLIGEFTGPEPWPSPVKFYALNL